MGFEGWGYFMQGGEEWENIERLAHKLMAAIECPIHYPAFGKRLFECKCGVIFALYTVDGSTDKMLVALHGEKKRERKLLK